MLESMDVHELRTLRLLEAIDHKRSPSQRDLAQALGVSLGLANAFVRRLAKKGYFKITHLPRNRIRYIMTPKGAAEKSRLTYAYVQLSYRFYREARRKLKSLFKVLQSRQTRAVAFYGTGELAEIAYLSLQETDLRFAGIADDACNGGSFFGHTIMDTEALRRTDFDVVVVTTDQIDAQLKPYLESSGIGPDRIETF